MNALRSLPVLLLAALAVACSSEPNRSRTGAYATNELTVRAWTTVRSDLAKTGHTSISFSASGLDLFVGEGDELFIFADGRRKDAHSIPTSSFSFSPTTLDHGADVSFLHDGSEYGIPVWDGPLPRLTIPEELTPGATFEIDLSPRPPAGTTGILSLGSCVGTASVQLDELPWKLDAAQLRKPDRASEECCEGAPPNRRCTARFEAEYTTRVRPFEQGPFHASSEITTDFVVRADGSLRL